MTIGFGTDDYIGTRRPPAWNRSSDFRLSICDNRYTRQLLFPPSLKNTAVFLWIGKTTVCRIFSCQRSFGGPRPPNPSRRRLRGARCPAPASAGAPPWARRASSRPPQTLTCSLAGPAAPHATRTGRAPWRAWASSRPPQKLPIRTLRHRRERLVENTGLEPVTSWLQTRRSPS